MFPNANSASASRWLNWPYYNPGSPNLVIVPEGSTLGIMADANWDMAQTILQDLKDPTRFLSATPDPQYKDQISYAMNLIAYAVTLTQGPLAKYLVPAGWNPQQVGLMYAETVFNILQQIPVNKSDPNTVDVFTAWIHGTGQLFGGHPPLADVSPISDPSGPAQAGTIFAH